MKTKYVKSDQPRHGTAVVEAALVLPVFFLAIAGIVEFGWGMMASQLVTNAAREGARRAIIDGNSNTAVEDYISASLVDSLKINATDVTVTIEITPDPSNTTTGNNLLDAQPYDLIMVRVEVPYDAVGLIAGQWLGGTNIVAQATMRHE